MNARILLFAIGGLLALVVLLIIAAVACSPRQAEQTEEPITLSFWTVFGNEEQLQPIIEKFEQSNPNVNIELRKLTYAEYQKTLDDALAANRGPDIFSVQNYWMPKFFDKIGPISESAYKTEDYRKDFYPAASDTIKDDRIFGIPMTMDVLGLYVNEELLRRTEPGEVPRTWEDLVGNPETNKPNILPRLNNRQGNTFNQSAIALGTPTIPRAADILALMMLQQRTQMTNQDQTQATFNLTQTVDGQEVHLGTDALNFYTSFANPATTNYSWNTQAGDPVAAFSRGRVAMLVGYAYLVPVIERQNPDLSFSVKPVPQIAGTEPVNYANYWAETVAKNSQHQELAWKFVRFLTDRDQMDQYAEATQQIPARKEAGQGGGKIEELRQQLETAQTWYKGDAEKADEFFLRMIGQVLAGENPQGAIDRAANDLTVIYQQLKAGR